MVTKITKNRRFWPPLRHGTPTNICMNLVLPQSRVPGLHFCCWWYGSILFQIFVFSSQRRIICALKCGTAVQGHPSGARSGLPISNFWKSFTDPETRVFVAANSEDLVMLALHRFDRIAECDRHTQTDTFAIVRQGFCWRPLKISLKTNAYALQAYVVPIRSYLIQLASYDCKTVCMWRTHLLYIVIVLRNTLLPFCSR